jgi:hypothetical protein
MVSVRRGNKMEIRGSVKYEYSEGEPARKKFESAMKVIFRAPKGKAAEKRASGAASRRKRKRKKKGDSG